MAIMYRGFSTVNRSKKFRMVDFELVKQDLINHFNIRKGEKLMNPNFGTIIWNIIHDPLTEELKNIILDDITAVINHDPRVTLENMIVSEYLSGIKIVIDMRYLATNETNTLNLQFDNSSSRVTSH